MLVKAKAVGVYGKGNTFTRRFPMNHPKPHPLKGQPFHLEKASDFSAKWMEIVEATPEERKIAEAKIKALEKKG